MVRREYATESPKDGPIFENVAAVVSSDRRRLAAAEQGSDPPTRGCGSLSSAEVSYDANR